MRNTIAEEIHDFPERLFLSGCQMLQKSNQNGCAEFRREMGISRRGFLKAGGLGLTGLTLTDLLRHEAQAGAAAKKENSVIIL